MIITLLDKETNTTAVIDSLGAQLISLKDRDQKEYIWQRDPQIWARCSPLLFPAVGGCRNGKTRFEDTWFDMEKHGFCTKCDFSVTDHDCDHAVFSLSASEYTRRFYPYDFLLTLTYRLKQGVLFMDYSVKNLDSRTMYYCIGAHPGFICPLAPDEAFDDYQLEFEQEEFTWSTVYDAGIQAFDPDRKGICLDHTKVLPLSYDLFREDAVYFDQIRSRVVSLIHHQTRKGVQVSYPGFETVAFWTPNGKNAPFLCVEPWNGSAIWADEDDEFSHRRHVQVLEPDSAKHYGLEIRILHG